MTQYVEVADDRGNTQRIPVPARGMGMNPDDRTQVNQLARSDAGRTAAAVAAGNLLTDFIGTGASSQQAAEKAAEVIGQLGEQLSETEYAPERVGPAQERTPAGIVVVQEPQLQPVDYELPAEYQQLLADEPEDEEDEELLEPAASVEDEYEFDDADLLADPRLAQLKAQAEKARKQADHERKLRLKQARPAWEAEALQVFRLGATSLLTPQDVKGIRADSKREFLRQAKTLADSRKQWLQATGGTTPQPQARGKSEDEIRAELKQEMWGAPPGGTPPADLAANDREQRLAKARRSGSLANVFKEYIRG